MVLLNMDCDVTLLQDKMSTDYKKIMDDVNNYFQENEVEEEVTDLFEENDEYFQDLHLAFNGTNGEESTNYEFANMECTESLDETNDGFSDMTEHDQPETDIHDNTQQKNTSLQKSSTLNSSAQPESPENSTTDHRRNTNGYAHESFLLYNRTPKSSESTSLITLLKGDFQKPPEKLQCYTCEKVFEHKFSLKCHLLVDSVVCFNHGISLTQNDYHLNTQKMPNCEICGKLFHYQISFDMHQRTVHSKENNYKCFFCCDEFKDTLDWNTHVRVIHGQKNSFKCNECAKTFDQEFYLNKHLLLHLIDKFQCDVCGQQFTEKSAFCRHIRTHENGLKCKTCGLHFLQKSYLDSHLLTSHGQLRKFICNICGKEFQYRYKYKAHLLTHKSNHIETLDESLRSNDSLSSDHGLQNGNDSFDHSFRNGNDSSSSDHGIKNGKDTHDERIICDICKKIFVKPASLERHLLHIHSLEKTWKCITCGKEFLKQIHLNKHEQIHSKVRDFKCDVCDREFVRKDHLKRHLLKIHSRIC